LKTIINIMSQIEITKNRFPLDKIDSTRVFVQFSDIVECLPSRDNSYIVLLKRRDSIRVNHETKIRIDNFNPNEKKSNISNQEKKRSKFYQWL
jgi:hypothetical protein